MKFRCNKSILYIIFSDLGAVQTGRHQPMDQMKKVVKKDKIARIMVRRISMRDLDVAQMERRLLKVQKIKVVS